MFHKPFRVKTQTSIKGSDRKKLRGDVAKLYPSLNQEDVNVIVPPKEEMTVAKVFTHSGEILLVYCLQNNPIFFELDKKLFPTVYALWKYPELLPVFTTWPPVFNKLAGGADLMLPGVVVREEMSPTSFGKLKKGDVCAVNLVGNRAPVAVGVAALSGEDMFHAAMRGKGVQVVHIQGDYLWQFGDKSDPPDLGSEDVDDVIEEKYDGKKLQEDPEHQVPNIENLSVQEMETDQTGGDNSEGAVGGTENEIERDPVADMDELLTSCFLYAIKSQVKKSDLPLLTNIFFKNYMQLFCSVGQTIDVKKSSFKKLSKFLQHMEDRGFIVVKELSKGVDSIVEIDKTHSDLRSVEVPDIPEEAAGSMTANDEANSQSPVITEVFSVTSAVLPVLKEKGYSKNDVLTGPEVRKLITDYVKTNNLQDDTSKSYVQLDPILAHLLLRKEEGDLSHLKWDDIFSRFFEKMQPACQLVFTGRPPIIRKGKIEPIKITVAQRASNKKATLIENLEAFGIDPQALAHAVQKGVACSTSVTPHHQKNKGMQVMIQGNQISYVADLLIDKYKIPRKYIQGLEKAPKSKRR